MAVGLLWSSPWRAFCFLMLCGYAAALGGRCDREPDEARSTPRSPADGRFSIRVSGNPDKYVPGEVYTVTLQGSRSQQATQKFSGFMLVVESAVGGSEPGFRGVLGSGSGLAPLEGYSGHYKAPLPVGSFQLFGDALTKFSERCPNMVTQTSSIPKSEIQVLWTAPAAGSGCVIFKATVVESRDVWYMDEGLLSRELCEEVQENHDEQPQVLDPCCACDEAKYEVTFEGLWSRHTHPKDFPTNSWLTRFSDVIGASHTADYRFWEYGGISSDGLKNVAEKGSTRMLESELKAQSEHIRTIIKARGISYPNVTGKTFAVFRVDKKHHLMSLVSMLDPSPDWIVGVSGLELCLRNCSWVESKVLNLYPWDAGTDDGITYLSPDSPTTPRDSIRRITSSFPNDKRSPFYDPTGAEMKPLARLYLSRQRLYEKTCGPTNGPRSDEDDDRPECAVNEWSNWSSCSVTCGRGVRNRQRYFLNVRKAQASNCEQKLSDSIPCLGNQHHCEPPWGKPSGERKPDSWCAVSEWGAWSSCSVSCGRGGERTRSRHFMSRLGRKKCSSPPRLSDSQPCPQPLPPCADDGDSGIQVTDTSNMNPNCRVGQWSDWSACSVTCGKGIRRRVRVVQRINRIDEEEDVHEDDDDDEEDEDDRSEASEDDECSNILRNQEVECQSDEASCELNPHQVKEACTQERLVGPCRGYFPRWYFDVNSGTCQMFVYGGCRQNRNNFISKEECERVCQPLKEEVRANLTARLQQYGVSVSGTLLYAAPRSAGYSKDASLHHRRPTCAPGEPGPKVFAGLSSSNQLHHSSDKPKSIFGTTGILPSPTVSSPTTTAYFLLTTNDGPIVDCEVTPWSKWTECSATCGPAWREKWRDILVNPKNGGRRCPKKLLKRKKCRLPPCEDESHDLFPTWGEPDGTERVPNADCKLGEWSQWSPCSQSCGEKAFKQRTRTLLVAPGPLGKPCGTRLEYRPCGLLPCLLRPRP